MIKILYFAGLREATGCAGESLALPAGVTDVQGVLDLLRARGGAWAEALAETKRVRAAVNQDLAGVRSAVRDGDELAFFPPVTGG